METDTSVKVNVPSDDDLLDDVTDVQGSPVGNDYLFNMFESDCELDGGAGEPGLGEASLSHGQFQGSGVQGDMSLAARATSLLAFAPDEQTPQGKPEEPVMVGRPVMWSSALNGFPCEFEKVEGIRIPCLDGCMDDCLSQATGELESPICLVISSQTHDVNNVFQQSSSDLDYCDDHPTNLPSSEFANGQGRSHGPSISDALKRRLSGEVNVCQSSGSCPALVF